MDEREEESEDGRGEREWNQGWEEEECEKGEKEEKEWRMKGIVEDWGKEGKHNGVGPTDNGIWQKCRWWWVF